MANLLERFFNRGQATESKPGIINPLQRLGSLIGGGNVGEVGTTIFEIATQLHQDSPGVVQSIERLRNMWSAQTENGVRPEGAVGQPAALQASFEEVAKLEPGDSSVLYVPGGSGITRLFISRPEKGSPEVKIDDRSLEQVKTRFAQLSTPP